MFDTTGTGPQPVIRLVVTEDDGAETTQPCPPAPDKGPRAFLRRRQEERIAEAHNAGRAEECDATACAAATAMVPQTFLAACRLADTTPREVTVNGMRITIVPSRRATKADPAAELAAWETFREIVLTATLGATGDVVSTAPHMPPQITAASWRTPDGHQLRVTAGCTQIGWLRHRLNHLPGGGVASIVPVVGITVGKFASAAAVVAVGVVVAVTPGGPVTPPAADGVPHDIVQEFVPSLGAFDVPDKPKVTPTRRPSVKPGSGSAPVDDPSPHPAVTGHPASGEEPAVPPPSAIVEVPEAPVGSPPVAQDVPTPEATVAGEPTVAPSLPVEVPSILDAS